MDSPERIQIAGTPLSKFEDSPVFNFINSLSPIQPVNSVHCVQAYTSPGFASISSVFSSPHVNLPKESRFLSRPTYLDSSKQENSTEDGDGSTVVSNSVELPSCIVATRETSNIKCSLNEATLEPPDECSSLPSDLPPFVEYNSGSPNHNTAPCYSTKLDPEPDITTLAEPSQFAQDSFDKRKCLFGDEIVRDDHRIEQVKEEFPGCEWESLISNNAGDLLIFDASKKSEVCEGQDEKLGNNGSSFRASYLPKLPEDVADDSEETQPDSSFGLCPENTTLHPHTIHSGEEGDQDETNHAKEIFAGACQNQIESQQQRGMPRRCLVFEASGVSKRNLIGGSGLHSDSLPSNMKFAFDSRLVPLQLGACSSGRVFPGIGLHLNTIGTTSKDRMVTQETLASGRRLTTMPSSIGSDLPRAARQESFGKSENDSGPTGSEVHDLQIMHDDAARAPEFGSSEDLSQSSPKKKRRKSENCGETEACKRCNCKKSKCLKLYCECFAAGVYCVESCSCQGCYNKPIHEEIVLATRKQIESRNPLAFAPKVIRMCETVQDRREKANKTPASARHKRGCNCKKSSCLKKYCECYQGGVGCSISCRCEGCKNAFGRKDDVMPVGPEETEPAEEEMGVRSEDEGQENAHVSKESIILATPLQICSASLSSRAATVKPPGKPPRLSTPLILNACRIPLSKCESGKQVVEDDSTPEFLRGNGSPSNCVKTSSPNGKRVSSPYHGIGPSPSRRGSRKLILRSIPSFPSLNSDATDGYPANHSAHS